LENNIYYDNNKNVLNNYLREDKDKIIIINFDFRYNSQTNPNIKNFINKQEINSENLKIYSADEDEILKEFFNKELKLNSERSFAVIIDNKISTIE